MGFYGSVYYQLINTFYKFIAENDGYSNSVRAFPTSIPNSDITIEANGRKSVIDLNTGNRWLSFTREGDKVLLWHNRPDNDANNITAFTSFTGAGGAENKKGGNSVAQATQLNYGDEFSVDSLIYDKAGHISGQSKKYFILPQELVNYKVDAIEKLLITTLGDKENINKKIESIQAQFPEGAKDIFEYIKWNHQDNDVYHRQYLGDWNTVFEAWEDNGAPTVTNVVGNLDNLYQGQKIKGFVNGSQYQSSLVDCIGDMSQIAQDYKENEEAGCSISEALHEFKKEGGILPTLNNDIKKANDRIDEANANITTTNVAVEGVDKRLDIVEDTMGSKGDYARVYTEIGKLHATDATEKDAREKADADEKQAREKADSDEKEAREKAVADLNKRLDDEEDAREKADSDEKQTRENAIADLNKRLDDEKAAREKNISDEAATRDTADKNEATARENADKNEATAREAADTVLDGKITAEAKTREEADTALDDKIAAEATTRGEADAEITKNLNDEVTNRTNAISAIHTIIGKQGETSKNIYSEIGSLHEKDTLIDSSIQTINATIGAAEGLDSVYAEIRALKTADVEIKEAYKEADEDIVETYIGGKPEGWETLYTEVNNIKNNITATNARFGDSITADKTAATQLSELREYADDTFETKESASKYAIADDYTATKDLQDLYLTIKDASDTYVTRTTADDTYLTKENAGQTYVTKDAADKAYLTKENAENTYVKPASLDNYILKSDLDTSIEALNKYAVKSELELDKYAIKSELGASLDSLIVSLQTPDPESGQVLIKTLEDLLNKIVGLEAEVESLKTPSTESTEE